MRKLLTVWFRLFAIFAILFFVTVGKKAIAQESGILPDRDGIKMAYELNKTNSKEKKDQYIIVVTAKNTNDFDLYYTVPMTKQPDGNYKINSIERKSFCDISIENSIGILSIFDKSANLKGSQTTLTTRNNDVLFKVAKDQVLTANFKFNVRSGQKPVITSSYLRGVKTMSEFDIGINGLFINGSWEVSCGNNRMTLAIINGPQGQVQLQQSINGKQQLWIMVSENIFEKQNDKNASLTYNRIGNIFTYSNIDGMICVWSKK